MSRHSVLILSSQDWSEFYRLDELVADDFLVTPIFSNLVDIDDVVSLSYGNFSGIRRKSHAFHHVALSAILHVSWFGGEFISSLPMFIIQQYHSVHGADSKFGIVLGPSHAGHFCSSILRAQQGPQVLQLHGAHLSLSCYPTATTPVVTWTTRHAAAATAADAYATDRKSVV